MNKIKKLICCGITNDNACTLCGARVSFQEMVCDKGHVVGENYFASGKNFVMAEKQRSVVTKKYADIC